MSHRLLSRLLLCVVCWTTTAIGAASASALPLVGAGVHPQGTDNDPSVIRKEFGLLHQAGANTVRFDVMWHSVEWTAKGVYDAPTLARLDYVFSQAAANGLKVILDVWSTPCWASAAPPQVLQGCAWGWWNGNARDYGPRNPQDYASFAAFVAKRWSSSLAALEIWNEPNGGNFFRSAHPATDYAALVRATYPAVKAVAPKLPVLMSLGGTDSQFLSWLYAAGVRGFYDGIAVHPYNQPTLAGLKAFRAYQTSQGDISPLWVTEVGWPSNSVGLQGEADQIGSAIRQLAALPYIRAIEVYDMRDGGTDPTDVEDHFGLTDPWLNPKPAWNSFVSALQGVAALPTTPSPTTPSPTTTTPKPPIKASVYARVHRRAVDKRNTHRQRRR